MTENLFLRLIHPSSIEEPVRINSGELKEMKILAADHHLLLLLFKMLKDRLEHIVPREVILEFLEETEALYYRNVSHATIQQETASRIVALLKAQGISSLVFRGSEIAADIYGDPFCRTSADIDILLRISDVLTADKILTNAGFSRTDRFPLKFLLSRLHHAVYRDPDTRDLVELHWNFAIPSYFRIESEEIWEGISLPEGQQPKLSPEMTVIQLLIHHHMHAFRELKILVDILWAFQKYEKSIDWQKFVTAIERIGLSKVTQIALSQIRNIWENTERLKTEEILSGELMRKGYKAPAYLLSFFSMDIKKKYQFQNPADKFMVRLTLDRWNTILYSFSKTFFPPPGAIKDLYGDCRNWTLPVNYVRFIAWRIGKQ